MRFAIVPSILAFVTLLVVWLWRRSIRHGSDGRSGRLVPDDALDVAVVVAAGAGEALARALGPLIGRALRTEIEMGAPGARPRVGRRVSEHVDRITITTTDASGVLEAVLRALEMGDYRITRVEGREVHLDHLEFGPGSLSLERHALDRPA